MMPDTMTEEDESLPQDAADDSAGDESDGSFFIPSGSVAGKKYAAGDTITFQVVGTDKDGDVEVKMSGGGKSDTGDFTADLRKEMMNHG